MKYNHSWKGYNFDILNKLTEEDCIADGKKSKSVGITEDGIAKAKELLKKYAIEE